RARFECGQLVAEIAERGRERLDPDAAGLKARHRHLFLRHQLLDQAVGVEPGCESSDLKRHQRSLPPWCIAKTTESVPGPGALSAPGPGTGLTALAAKAPPPGSGSPEPGWRGRP